ncbi:non-histone chromosomal protein HMG-14A-like [Salarias fasciatus]|uniref:non-histone chromosomal protein HMG-14A-like n=1 Tax=Salarias fasciatus TaxID=181472 RepID=UPI001176B121|nr:non-histone chromosomal protein HMG-14-like [Salarias fasciatus]
MLSYRPSGGVKAEGAGTDTRYIQFPRLCKACCSSAFVSVLQTRATMGKKKQCDASADVEPEVPTRARRSPRFSKLDKEIKPLPEKIKAPPKKKAKPTEKAKAEEKKEEPEAEKDAPAAENGDEKAEEEPAAADEVKEEEANDKEEEEEAKEAE